MGVAKPLCSSAVNMAEGHTSAAKCSYDMAFKLKVVACAEAESNRGAPRKFGIDEKCVREWRKYSIRILYTYVVMRPQINAALQ